MKRLLAFVAVAFIASRFIGADSDIDGLRQEVTQLRNQNADLERRLLEASAPPIQIGRRKALTGDGYVIQIANQSMKTLPVKVHLESSAFGKEADYDLVLPPAKIISSVKEIGHLEGWTAAPGDTVKITCPGYNLIEKTLTE